MTATLEDSNLVKHAKREMELAGLYDEDADYGGLIPDAVMNVVEAFAKDGHSGGSAAVTLAIVEKVLRFETLTPITSNPMEWNHIADDLWQSNRDPRMFSTDAGQTWYNVDDR